MEILNTIIGVESWLSFSKKFIKKFRNGGRTNGDFDSWITKNENQHEERRIDVFDWKFYKKKKTRKQ